MYYILYDPDSLIMRYLILQVRDGIPYTQCKCTWESTFAECLSAVTDEPWEVPFTGDAHWLIDSVVSSFPTLPTIDTHPELFL